MYFDFLSLCGKYQLIKINFLYWTLKVLLKLKTSFFVKTLWFNWRWFSFWSAKLRNCLFEFWKFDLEPRPRIGHSFPFRCPGRTCERSPTSCRRRSQSRSWARSSTWIRTASAVCESRLTGPGSRRTSSRVWRCRPRSARRSCKSCRGRRQRDERWKNYQQVIILKSNLSLEIANWKMDKTGCQFLPQFYLCNVAN